MSQREGVVISDIIPKALFDNGIKALFINGKPKGLDTVAFAELPDSHKNMLLSITIQMMVFLFLCAGSRCACGCMKIRDALAFHKAFPMTVQL
jgi:hypothetical protein